MKLNKSYVIMLARGGLIAALYVVFTLPFASFGFGQVQFRVSEAFTMLPVLFPEAIPGLFVGCLVSNIIASPFGIWDVALGSLATLVAGYLTYLLRKQPLLAALPPVLCNAVAVGFILMIGAGLPLFESMLYVGLGEAAAVFVLGVPLIIALKRVLKLDV